mmetsp:Transcript_35179/g.89048  ORF Transcript_35179/g.89048 Transcript_35179/m.89048 type:complete len:519 (-) Transcript_35179:279-1835(-)|eukprot:CAMPEP_0202858918 /NCGR_PEP_ID=MMETSP1391-20130828/1249_1 /ASSEMBLY_ACC=CAM_ASM_000867 /TAXON_ID=1034604 /ORGANISM="Chlamydomonas leiostraca, Strain SAG 11-49" /LENGTH=518 /DNA_ID=CAMNT_0049537897 /DNA_START=157 /DNA_END=1713 /DNA_ORIENTATION=-
MDHLDHVPDLVKQFCHYFYRHIRERNIPEIQSMYEVSFLKLSERYYKTSPWPAVELIQDVVDQDHVFCLLYKEMYFRHLYARCQPDLRQRCESWDNYCDLFGLLLHSNVNMQLPNIWLWDMVDEFIYQFQSFCQYRGKGASRSAEEAELLKQCDKVWAVGEVLNVLQALVDKSGVVAELAADGGARFNSVDGYYPNTSNVLRMLGYFSLVGLLRVHALIGDYQAGLKAMYPLNVNEPQRHLFTPKIAGAHITLCYYAGFSYMMMRRYLDAARVFNSALAYINRVKQYHARSVQYDQILKKNEQMYALLACVCALCPVAAKALDENVATQLRERNGEKMGRMARGDLPVYDELFSYACPKFITPAIDISASTNTSQAAYRAQLGAFLAEVKACSTLPLLKQYLLLYSSIDIRKLATLMEVEEGALRTQLTCLKAKAYARKWNGGADATAGAYHSASDIDFYIDVDPASGREMVIVSDSVHQRQHADFLARHIGKLEGIIRDLEAASVAGAPAPKAQAAY